MSTPCLLPQSSVAFFPGTKGDKGDPGPAGPASTVPGPAGESGPIGVYTGTYASTTTYYDNADRRDIVFYAGRYWIAQNSNKNGLASWSAPNVGDWTDFGASLVMVATALALLNNTTIAVALNILLPGLLKSDNFIAAGGVFKGWALNGGTSGAGGTGGSAQFYDAILAGQVSTDTPKFNLAEPDRTMPAVAYAEFDIVAIADGAIPANPTINNVTDNALIIFGWKQGPNTFLEERFGNSTQKFTVNLEGTGSNETTPGTDQFFIQIYYRTRNLGGAWGAWTVMGRDWYMQALVGLDQSFQLVRDLSIALTGDQDIQFSAGFSKGAGATPVAVAGAKITVKAYN